MVITSKLKMDNSDMIVNKRRNFNIQIILDRISEERTILPNGGRSVTGFGVLDDFESYLRTAISIEGKTDAFVRSVVAEAMHEKQHMTEDYFIKSCSRIAHMKESEKQKNYKVIFPIWGGTDVLCGKRKWNDVSITFDINKNSSFARRATRERAKQVETQNSRTEIDINKFRNLPLASCSTSGVNIRDAFEKAESAISKELGLYSVVSSRGKFIFTNDPDKPINTILLAPHMTVHDQNGSLSADIFWYNRWPDGLSAKKRSYDEIERITRNVDAVRKKIRNLPWKAEAEMALARHYSAFSQADLESAFLDGWRLLEAIGGHRTEKSDVLIRRAAWFFENREEQYQIGLHLMERRNLLSHGRPVRDESNESLAFQMKNFLTPFLHTFLTNPFKFKSKEELWSFCDLPVDREIRARRSYILSCSSKFRREI